MNLTDLLYYVCFALLPGMAMFVFLRNPSGRLHRTFALTALSLLGWLVTLFFFNRTTSPETLLLLGRLNFAAIVFAVYLGYRFVEAVAKKEAAGERHGVWLLWETVLLAGVTAFTPLVDKEEILGAVTADGVGRHITLYGVLFPLYLLHVIGYLLVSIVTAFRRRQSAPHPERDQLALIGSGILATGTVALVTNALLPYAFGDFRFIDVGTLSTILFLLAVAYAITRHRLFDIRVLVRKTLVYGLLLSFVLAAYSAVLVLVTEHLVGNGSNNGGDTFTRFGVLVIASSFDPLRRFLEKRIDRLLFRAEHTAKSS